MYYIYIYIQINIILKRAVTYIQRKKKHLYINVYINIYK